ncbi:hypothetical protein C922_03834 [Plasmodium inui San Antonio 1]|uniref:Uncharacterized protein n=1 Tax=Plasmodium inui San Antonio 1 TaxID=1237626 RepID=W7AKJ5_9APIC|nr:hypothetical protein C922_03834 [Plasmodium inui San Antonio 1]EUD65851.1 hypothetical protein C922_03834 [Plasmodium inui San Antonio 1]
MPGHVHINGSALSTLLKPFQCSENLKKMQENKNKKEIQCDLLKHNESLLEKIKEIYDKQGEI